MHMTKQTEIRQANWQHIHRGSSHLLLKGQMPDLSEGTYKFLILCKPTVRNNHPVKDRVPITMLSHTHI